MINLCEFITRYIYCHHYYYYLTCFALLYIYVCVYMYISYVRIGVTEIKCIN